MHTHTLLFLAFLTGCTHVRAEDKTVAEHRNAAAELKQQAAVERAQFEPGESRVKPPSLARMPVDGIAEDFTSYNPSAEHLTKADAYLKESSEHLADANMLLASADKACAGLPAGERFSCPLLASSVDRVQPAKTGVTLLLRPSVNREATLQRLNCHLAYAVASGFDRPSCPLFVKGTTLIASGSNGIEFKADTAPAAESLRAQARRIFAGTPGSTSY